MKQYCNESIIAMRKIMANNSLLAWPTNAVNRHGPAANAVRCRRNLPKRRAAILVSLCHCNGEAAMLYTLRSQHLGTHAGHVSFPGGHLEPGEMSVDAAIRETYEELGEATGNIQILGQFSTIPAITGTLVSPVLGLIERDVGNLDHFTPQNEVAKIFVRSIEELRQCEAEEVLNKHFKMPYYQTAEGPADEKIWGLTAYVTQKVLHSVVFPSLRQ